MTKLQFILTLHDKLSAFPRNEVEERLSFYSEMIEDRMEEGLAEADAVAAAGSVEEIAAQIAAELSAPEIPEACPGPKKRSRAWQTTLLVLGFPLWFPLLIAAFAVALSFYAVLWAVIVSLWAVFVALCACVIAAVASGIGLIAGGNRLGGIALFCAALVCAGLAIFLFFGSRIAMKGAVLLTKKLVKVRIPGKEHAK